ncbi:MAG: T9SS type A sorting domain-containing protein [Bacteroidia bacterium]|nr:T9SS type A sorting domain-containing protein [Bacteroidia bacterium]
MLDDEENQSENIRYWLNRRDGLIDRYMASESWLEENNFENALAAVNDIPNDFRLKEFQTNEYNNYLDYLDFRNNIYQQEKTIMQLNATEISELGAIANANTGNTSRMARNILCFGYGLCDENSGGGGGRIAYDTRKVSTEADITTYPNPASTFAAIDWNLSKLDGVATIKITDAVGRMLEQREINKKQGEWIWDTRKIDNGIYFYEIKSNNKSLGNGKIIISN